MLNTFACTFSSLTYLLQRNVCLDPLHNFNCWFFAVAGVPYVIFILTPYQIYGLQISLHPINSLFTLLVVSFALRKFFSLMQSHLSAFAFLACSVVTYPWFHTWLDQCCKVFPASVFFLEFCSLRVLLCIFNLLWVDLCMWSEKGPISFLYIWMSSFPAPSVERLPFPPYVFLAPLLKISWPIDTHRFISGPLVLFLWSVWKFLSHVWLFVTPWTIRSMEFSRPEYWSG